MFTTKQFSAKPEGFTEAINNRNKDINHSCRGAEPRIITDFL
jgi:hypothetical protein